VYRFVASGRWVSLAVFVVLMVIACLLLSRWQFHRLHTREAYNSVVSQNINRAPVTPDEVLAVGRPMTKADLWRSVGVSGHYDASHVLLVRKRSLESQAGFYVMTPFRSESGVGIWLNRGWIRAAATAQATPDVPPTPTGTVTVVARLRFPEPSKAYAPADLPTGQIDRIDIAQMSKRLGYTVYPAYGEVITENPATVPAPRPIPAPETSNGPHLSYALQWITFAIIAVVGFFILIRKEAERLAEEEQAAAIDASTDART